MLHSGCATVREAVVDLLIEDGQVKTATRYALCGCGDRLVVKDGVSSVGVRGCGHSLCPRCSRRKGSKYVRRVQGWLAYEPHGDMWNICLTQKVRPTDNVVEAKERMAPKVRTFMRWLSRRGLIGATTAHHVIWSPNANGWHYHVHVVVEVPAGELAAEAAAAEWDRIGSERGERHAPLFIKPLATAGGALVELREDNGDSDFWKESTNQVARVIQYPMRDMAQGVSAWRLGGDAVKVREVCCELLRNAKGWKLRRAWGRWRKNCPAAEAAKLERAAEGEAGDDAGDGDKAKAAVPGKVNDIGTVRRVWIRARKGEFEARMAMKSLEASVRNKGDFAKRFVMYCRMAWSREESS